MRSVCTDRFSHTSAADSADFRVNTRDFCFSCALPCHCAAIELLFSGLSAEEFPVFLSVCSAVEHCLITYCFPVATVSLAYILPLRLIVLHSGAQLYLTLSASAVLSVLDHMRSACRSCLLELWFQVEICFFLLHAGLEMSGYLPRQSQPCILARTVVLCCAREGFCMLQISMCVALLWVFLFALRSGEERPKRVVKRCFGGIFEVSVVAERGQNCPRCNRQCSC